MDKILKQFGEYKIREIVEKSNSFVEVTFLLGLDSKNVCVKKNVERTIKRLGISVEHFDSVQRLKDSKTRYTKEKLEKLVKECDSYKEILEKLDVLPLSGNYDRLKKAFYRFKIDFSHLKHQKIQHKESLWTKEILIELIKHSKTQKEVLEKLEIRGSGGNFNTLKKYIKLYNIDTSHFTKNYEVIVNFVRNKKIPLDKILIENSTYNRNNLKKRLYEENLKKRKCELCGQDENWQGKHMSLILDHINGVHNDNRLENLRIVCPNCNATLDTYCGKNSQEKLRELRNKKQMNIENSFIARRIVQRPPFEELKIEIESLGLEGTGRKYGVTGASIKKWIKTYNKYGK